MKKAYVVFKGRKPGIYKTWAECKAQVDGFSGPVFRGYASMEEAKEAFEKQDAGYAARYKSSSEVYDAKTSVAAAAAMKAASIVHKDFKPEYDGEYYEVHSDGGARGNQNKKGKTSGYGYVVVDKDHKIIAEGYGSAIGATNNQMELQGAIEGLKKVPDGAKVYFMTDSVYVYSGFAHNFPDEPRYQKWEAKGWKNSTGKTPENIEQVKEIYELGRSHSLECIPRDYEMHANGRGKYISIAHGDVPDEKGKWKNPYNKICDALANLGEDDAERGKEGKVSLIENGEQVHDSALFVKDLDASGHGYVVDQDGNNVEVN